MAKATTPTIECSPDNCGELFEKCGKRWTYERHGCRCDSCRAIIAKVARRDRAVHAERINSTRQEWRAVNAERIREQRKLDYAKKTAGTPRAKRKLEPVACGTRTAYARGCRCELCIEAKRKYGRLMYQRHREKHLAYQSARRQENIEESRAIARQWRRDHPELAKQKDREQYARNASKNAQRKREKRAANPELTRDSSNEWRRRTGKGATYSQNRRAVLIAAWVEDVDILAVFNRDGYVCQICGIDCPPDLKWPERNAPTLDHIIPLAWGVFRGGFHSYANCQTACFECNARKGARE